MLSRLKPRPTIREIDPDWSANQLLSERGIFVLGDVCQLMALNAVVLQQWIKAKDLDIGIFFNARLGYYLVRMETFSTWFKNKRFVTKG